MVLLIQMVVVTALFFNIPIQLQGAVETVCPDVVDVDWHTVVLGGEYYVLPAVAGSGIGMALKMSMNNNCPMYVTQENFEILRGLPPVLKHAEDQRVNYLFVFVREHANLNVNMGTQTVCIQSTAWSAKNENDGNTTKRFIKASDPSSLFQFVKEIDGYGYVLYFFPCNCRLVCTKVGIYVDDDENRQLVIDNSVEALRVQFHKNG